MLLQGNQGQTGKQMGQNLTLGTGEYTEALITELMARYYQNTYRGLKFTNLFASSALTAAATSAQCVIINPTGSQVNLVLLDAYTAFTAFTPTTTGANIALGWFACAATPSTIGTLQTPLNCKIGSSVKSNAICAPTATVLVAPAYARSIAGLYADLAASDIGGVHDDIAGALILTPGFGLGLFEVNGTASDISVGVSLTWDEIPV
jgi:hypothetical protein